jgi:NgoMIV restriction enzyme
MMRTAIISEARRAFHDQLKSSVLFTHDAAEKKSKGGDKRSASNADDDSAISRKIAASIAEQLGAEPSTKKAGQTSGSQFEIAVKDFLATTFLKLGGIRPGDWHVNHVSARSGLPLANYEQFSHLATLDEALRKDRNLAVVLGNIYSISPDIVIFRNLLGDDAINSDEYIVDSITAKRTDLRKSNGGKPLLHASISCKWTMRSDRAQNARSEALNLIRNRKGRTPHIAVVVGEPLPSRISSLAMGTGEFDCLYHFALYELEKAVADTREQEAMNILRDMIDGKRLKDISDLPLDLAS